MSSPSNRPDEQNALLNRLRSAEGHLHGVVGMVAAGEPCAQVLHQLEAVEAAIKAAERAMLTWEFRCCAEAIRHSPDADTRAAEVRRLAALCRFPIHPFWGAELTETESDEQTSRDQP